MTDFHKTDVVYKKDKLGRIRVFWFEVHGNGYRSHAGIHGGNVMISEFKYPRATNVGQSNARDEHEQAIFVVKAEIARRLERGGYTTDPSGVVTVSHFRPMLAEKFNPKNPPEFPVYAQPKLDGIRCIARSDGLWSRNGKPITSCVHIEKILAPFFEKFPDAVLDGELYNHDLKNEFEKISSLVRKKTVTSFDLMEIEELVEYHVYDCPVSMKDDEMVDDLWFGTRIEFLKHLKLLDHIKIVDTFMVGDMEFLDELYSHWNQSGYEGQMVRKHAAYDNFRSASLLKRKEFIDAEFTILRVEEGQGAWSGAAKRIVCDCNGAEFGSGVRGTYELNAERLKDAKLYVGGLATVRFQNYTGTARPVPRFGVVVNMTKKGEDRL